MDSKNRDVFRGVWELSRLHTREAWICWYPAVWGACIAAGTQNVSFDICTFGRILFGIWASVTSTHCTFCTFNDICDRNLDAHVDRCKTRPLPAGMITLSEATFAFIVWIQLTIAVTRWTLGAEAILSFLPIWILSAVYPFMKRIIHFPQVVLGFTIGGAVFPGWVAVMGELKDLSGALPLFWATFCWVIYFDVIYATQDAADDAKVGVKSLAVFFGQNVYGLLGFLGLLQVVLFVVTAFRAQLSPLFWVMGIGAWTLSIPWDLLHLDLSDPKSGGRIFKLNIQLGLYMTVLTIVELALTRVDSSWTVHERRLVL